MLDAAKAALEDSEAIPGMAREVCRNGAEQVVVAAPAPLGFLDGFPLKEVSERASAVRVRGGVKVVTHTSVVNDHRHGEEFVSTSRDEESFDAVPGQYLELFEVVLARVI